MTRHAHRFASVIALLLAGLLAGARTLPHVLADHGAVLVRDSFDDPASGVLPAVSTDPEHWFLGYDAGEYVMGTLDPRSSPVYVFLSGTFTDASLAIDVRLVGESSDVFRRYAALACRWHAYDDDTDTGYRMTLNTVDGWVLITRWDEGTSTTLVRQSSSVIQPWGQTNRAEFSCVGSHLSALVNGVEVASVDDSTYADGQFYFMAGVFANEEPRLVSARFDNLVVTRP